MSRDPRKDHALSKVRRKLPRLRRKVRPHFVLDDLFGDWALWRWIRGGRWEFRAARVGMPFEHWVRVGVATWRSVLRREDRR